MFIVKNLTLCHILQMCFLTFFFLPSFSRYYGMYPNYTKLASFLSELHSLLQMIQINLWKRVRKHLRHYMSMWWKQEEKAVVTSLETNKIKPINMDGNAAWGVLILPLFIPLQALERTVTSIYLKELIKCPAAFYKSLKRKAKCFVVYVAMHMFNRTVNLRDIWYFKKLFFGIKFIVQCSQM